MKGGENMNKEKNIKEVIEKAPKEITLCNLEVVVMPNGEIICRGKTVGWVKEIGKYLTKKI